MYHSLNLLETYHGKTSIVESYSNSKLSANFQNSNIEACENMNFYLKNSYLEFSCTDIIVLLYSTLTCVNTFALKVPINCFCCKVIPLKFWEEYCVRAVQMCVH